MDVTQYEYNDLFVNADIIKEHAKFASTYGLEDEFMMELFKILKIKPEDMLRACQGALMEWDM